MRISRRSTARLLLRHFANAHDVGAAQMALIDSFVDDIGEADRARQVDKPLSAVCAESILFMPPSRDAHGQRSEPGLKVGIENDRSATDLPALRSPDLIAAKIVCARMS